jgi:glucose-1-phosphate cytidylyltransferase
MKAIILAGGLGTRIAEETDTKPKPMVLLGAKPILWHVMSIFAQVGIKEFIVASGYKSEIIENWVQSLKTDWRIQVINTGGETQTGGRISMCLDLVPDQRVFVTYGDGLADLNVLDVLRFHEKQNALATVTAVRPPARFGYLETQNGRVISFSEKNSADSGWINGGFFVLERQVQEFIANIYEPFEFQPMERLVAQEKLFAFQHHGFWKPMDTLRDKIELEKLATNYPPPWIINV